jgi:hypothetical protein
MPCTYRKEVIFQVIDVNKQIASCKHLYNYALLQEEPLETLTELELAIDELKQELNFLYQVFYN